MASDQPALHIGLLWHSFESENLGMGALTVGNCHLIADALAKRGRRPVFHIIGARGRMDYRFETGFENDFTKVGYKDLATPGSALHRSIDRCDLFFDIGAGDSFSDIYGWRRFGLILASKWFAAKRGPLVMSPQTIGPFATRRSRIAATAIMKKARTVYARDEQSFAVLKEMGLEDRSRLTTDVAFALPYARPADKGTRDLTGKVRVGLNVSALLYRRDIATGDRIAMTVDYPRLINAVIARLLADPRVELHLVPHVLAIGMEYEDDYAVAEGLKAQYPALVLPARFAGPSAAKTYIADLDLLIGSRMHATVAALSSNTAVLPFGYSRKFSGLFGSLGYPVVGDLTAQDEPALLALLDAAMADLPGLTAAAAAANAEAQTRLNSYRAFLDGLFAELVPA